MKSAIIPRQKKGKENDLYFDRILETQDSASSIFKRGCSRLLDPNKWYELAGTGAKFKLVDNNGKQLRRLMRQSDYIRIDIPGPGLSKERTYDWVQVKIIEDHRNKRDSEEWLGIQLLACTSPFAGEKTEAQHFFAKQASSSFILRRQANTVISSYHGRNETINNHTGNLIENIRNTAVGLGAFVGLSELQWSKLIEGFLTDN